MKNRTMYMGALLTAAMLLAGCGNKIPEMDEETRALVVEYAAGVVEKYDQNRTVKLKEISETEAVPEETIQEEVKPEQTEAANAEHPDGIPDTEHPETEGVAAPTVTEAASDTASIEDFLKLEGVSFRYEGYETAEFYPNDTDELYFVMNATEDNLLFLLNVTVNNDTQEEKQIDMIHSGVRFKIEVNGESKNALTTMLLNDLSNYQKILAPGESEELVLVCEISKEQAESIASVSLIMKNADETATISLN